MPKPTYLFYDIETTGRNPCFDQILQFAAIRTDLELNELERHEINIKLNPDVIPDPEALLVHQIPLADLLQGREEMAAVKIIHDLVNTPGTLSGGYNTLNFDDEFLRFSFYRNLLPPYRHQYANNCGRFDLYPLTMLFCLFKPECLQWPELEGKRSLKLEQLNLANQLASGGNAHNALFDVEVTLALARRFFQHRSMWDYGQGYFLKDADKQRFTKLTPPNMANLKAHPLAILIGKNGAQDFYHSPALYLGEHHHYRNQQLWLRLDKPELRTTTEDNIPETSWAIRKKMGEQPLLLPFQDKYLEHLSAERQAEVNENIRWLNDQPGLFQTIKLYHLEYKYPVVEAADRLSNLYNNGFFSDYEMQFCQKIHEASKEKKPGLLDKINNPLLREQALRALGRNYPELLSAEQQEKFNCYLSQINTGDEENALVDFRGNPQLTPKIAISKINRIRESENILNPVQLQLLQDLEDFLKNRF